MDSKLLAAAIANKRVQYFPAAFTELPQWPDFVQLINSAKLRGDLDHRRSFYVRAPIRAQDLLQHLTKLEKVRSDLAAELALNVQPSSAYINLAINEEVWPSHADEEDSLFIQCEGSVKWILDDSEYTLNAGDAIYFPSMTMHEVTALSPRAAVILTID